MTLHASPIIDRMWRASALGVLAVAVVACGGGDTRPASEAGTSDPVGASPSSRTASAQALAEAGEADAGTSSSAVPGPPAASPGADGLAAAPASTSPTSSSTSSTSAIAETSTTSAAPDPSPAAPPPGGAWPAATGEELVNETIQVRGTFDGQLTRYVAGRDVGDGGQREGQKAVFELADGATLENVIMGAPAADGIHCEGRCTLRNVWWEDVGEDAATFADDSLVDGGGARLAEDKVFQHNGVGTLTIRNFEVADFGKLYRSCGNCTSQYERHVVIENVVATAPGEALVGINVNYGDTAALSGLTIVGDRDLTVCLHYRGNDRGSSTEIVGSGADETYCRYDPAAVSYR